MYRDNEEAARARADALDQELKDQQKRHETETEYLRWRLEQEKQRDGLSGRQRVVLAIVALASIGGAFYIGADVGLAAMAGWGMFGTRLFAARQKPTPETKNLMDSVGPQHDAYVSDSPPYDPQEGDMWLNPTTQKVMVAVDGVWKELTTRKHLETLGPRPPQPPLIKILK